MILIFEKIKLKKLGETGPIEEDLCIVDHVMRFGTQWARIARKLDNRTEHNAKNRFFGILSRYLEIPIIKIKKQLNYLNPILLDEVIRNYIKEGEDLIL